MLTDPVDALKDVAMRLDGAGVAYMITGSVAGYFYGLNRSTGDTDIVVDMKARQIPGFMAAFEDAWYVDLPTIEESIREREMFNVIPKGGGKLDFIPLRDEPFQVTKFERRVARDWHDRPLWVTTAPDLVLSKLEWARSSHSHQQFSDIRTIMAAGFVDEHDAYFQNWLEARDLRTTLELCRTGGHDA